MSKGSGMSQKLSRKSSDQQSVNQAARDEEPLINTKAALSLAQHSSGDAMHNSVLQLQRTIGNRAVGVLVSQHKTKAAVQRVIEYEANGMPKLDNLFSDAYINISAMVNSDMWSRCRQTLAPGDAMRTSTFQTAWDDKATRAKIRAFAKSEFSEDSVNFLLAVESYKESPSVDKAITIYTTYIRPGAPEEINLSQKARKPYDDAHTALTAAPVTRARSR
jgi:hypothetical protein